MVGKVKAKINKIMYLKKFALARLFSTFESALLLFLVF